MSAAIVVLAVLAALAVGLGPPVVRHLQWRRWSASERQHARYRSTLADLVGPDRRYR